LPWAGSESTKVENFSAVGKDDFTNIPMWKRITMISFGVFLCFLGVLEIVLAVLVVHRPPGVICYALMVGGAELCRRGDRLR
jgi:hypothetical protein